MRASVQPKNRIWAVSVSLINKAGVVNTKELFIWHGRMEVRPV